MCRADIAPQARGLLGQILGEQSGVPAESVVIGPVDFGDEQEHQP